MKKVLAIAFLGSLALSCAKKESTYEQDSNIMLEEPKVVVADSAAAVKPADQTAVNADSAAVTVDTATVK